MIARVSTAAVLALALALAACGSTQSTKTVTVTTSTPAAQPAAVAKTPPAHKRKRQRSTQTFVACDRNISAKAGTTSCRFAQNVFYEFWSAQQAGDDAVVAYSPVTHRSYDMTCAARTTVDCRGGDGSEVRFAMSAVDAYDASQAQSYRCTADLGPRADLSGCGGDGGSSSPADNGTANSGCDPNYSGACLDPNSPDYDCAGGSGDGPDYTGPVQVVGDDHYGLDRDGDGYACDS